MFFNPCLIPWLRHRMLLLFVAMGWGLAPGIVCGAIDIDIDEDGVPDFALTAVRIGNGPGQYGWAHDDLYCYRSNSVYVVESIQVPIVYPHPAVDWVPSPDRGFGWSIPGGSHALQRYGQERRPISEPPGEGNFAYRTGALRGLTDYSTGYLVVRFMSSEGWRLGWLHLSLFVARDERWDWHLYPPFWKWEPNPFPEAVIHLFGSGFSTDPDATRFRPGKPVPSPPPALTMRLVSDTNATPYLHFEVPPDLGWQQIETSYHAFGTDWYPAGFGFTNSTRIQIGPGTPYHFPSQTFFRLR